MAAALVLTAVLVSSCNGDGDRAGEPSAPAPTSAQLPMPGAGTMVRQLWEGDRVSIDLDGGCTNLLSLPRLDGQAKILGEVCSGQQATLVASGHFADAQFLWRRLDFDHGLSGWLVDGRSGGGDQPVVTLIAAGAGPSDGPYIATGTTVRIQPPATGCLTLRSFPSNRGDYSDVLRQLCEATSARAAADIRYRDEGFYWRRIEIGGSPGLVGWVTDGSLTGSAPPSVYDAGHEEQPSPSPEAPPTSSH